MPATNESPLFFEGEDDMDAVKEHVRKVALIQGEILKGKTNNTLLEIVLAAGKTETLIERDRICCDTIVTLTPKSATAAAAIAAGSLWIETSFGRITIHHDSKGDTDRIFGAVFVG